MITRSKEDEAECYRCKNFFKKNSMQNYFGAYYCQSCWKIVHPRKDRNLTDIGKEYKV